jgi:hypothetical protein
MMSTRSVSVGHLSVFLTVHLMSQNPALYQLRCALVQFPSLIQVKERKVIRCNIQGVGLFSLMVSNQWCYELVVVMLAICDVCERREHGPM